MVDDPAVRERIAQWHDFHAEAYPDGHPFKTMHQRTAAELRSGRPPVRSLPRFCWHQQKRALLVWAEWIGFPDPQSIRSVARPSELHGTEGVLLIIEGHPNPVPDDVTLTAERLGYRIVRLDDTLARRRHAALARHS